MAAVTGESALLILLAGNSFQISLNFELTFTKLPKCWLIFNLKPGLHWGNPRAIPRCETARNEKTKLSEKINDPCLLTLLGFFSIRLASDWLLWRISSAPACRRVVLPVFIHSLVLTTNHTTTILLLLYFYYQKFQTWVFDWSIQDWMRIRQKSKIRRLCTKKQMYTRFYYFIAIFNIINNLC